MNPFTGNAVPAMALVAFCQSQEPPIDLPKCMYSLDIKIFTAKCGSKGILGKPVAVCSNQSSCKYFSKFASLPSGQSQLLTFDVR